jgi:hypothetical protein
MKDQLSSILLVSLLHSTFAGSLRRTESDDQNNRDLYDGPQTRIVGGGQSEIGEFPYYGTFEKLQQCGFFTIHVTYRIVFC